ncbi:TadE/TadG family type IV pilus assembly protein [Methylopila henanensis]|uniref:TadE/TadG family type IV pilus assembly protein n=1 Tax=Methylopila henanensis TaxID=873516 RepID=A0ABW4K527_9HYPH
MLARRMLDRLRQLRGSQSGLAAVEFALAAPMLTILTLGGLDVARYALTVNKVMKAGFAVSDVTAQYDSLSSKQLDQIFRISVQNLPGYVSGGTGVTILSSVQLDSASNPKVVWQCFSSTGSAWTSKIGTAGGTATMDKTLLADNKDNLIYSEIYYKFTPMFAIFFNGGFDIYSKALYRPRLGALTSKPC